MPDELVESRTQDELQPDPVCPREWHTNDRHTGVDGARGGQATESLAGVMAQCSLPLRDNLFEHSEPSARPRSHTLVSISDNPAFFNHLMCESMTVFVEPNVMHKDRLRDYFVCRSVLSATSTD